ncbi:MAG: MurT ligase domain-containing protein [Arcanobacterium sp.]
MRIRRSIGFAAGKMASTASRILGKGSGGMIGGRIASAIAPDLLSGLAANKTVVLISGTNGKSTTTRMVTSAIAAAGYRVATNRGGDNLEGGIVAAMMADRKATHAVLEVDEMYVPRIARQVQPAALVFLNLSCDQLDRIGEMSTIEHRLRQAVMENPQAYVIANIDDPLVTSAAWDAAKPVWVAAGRGGAGNSLTCPRTGGVIVYGQTPSDQTVDATPHTAHSVPAASGNDKDVWWRAVSVDGKTTTPDSGEADARPFARPCPDYSWTSPSNTFLPGEPMTIHCPTRDIPTIIHLPGRANRSNASQALVTALTLGIDPRTAANGIAQVTSVAGRYSSLDVDGHTIRLLLAKNPAGWYESLSMLTPGAGLILGVNAQTGDGVDLSWLWDVDFSAVRDRTIVVCGERGRDLQVRLAYAGIDASFAADPLSALDMLPDGEVDLLLNYTVFRDTRIELQKRGYQL